MERLSDIAVFIQVINSGSFTAAADRLELSRSVISKYISRLEDQLGVRLLNRTTRRLHLTEAGELFYNRCQHSLDEIEAAELEVSELQKEPKGRLRLNVPMSFGILHVAPMLKDFQLRYPDVTIDMNLEDRQINLVEEGYDMAIRIAELPDSSLVARRLGPCRHVLCASPEYLENHGIPLTPDDLGSHRALTYGYHDTPREWKMLATNGQYISVRVNSHMHMNNSLALREAALAGAGLLLCPSFIAGQDIRAGRLQVVLPRYRLLEVSIYAVYPQRRHLSPKVRAFTEFMSEQISDQPGWDGF
jgi:DNA-binding transcriptional LysR family regulator